MSAARPVVRRTAPRVGAVVRHARLTAYLRVAVAAALAWAVVVPFGGVANAYPYYAPFGAVMAVSSTVVNSLAGTLRVLTSLVIGTGLALLVGALDLGEPLGIAVVVGLGAWAGSWSRLASAGSWVPTSGLFVLILGGGDPLRFTLGYVGLTAVGAAIGLAIALAAPTLRLSATQESVDRLRENLVDQLEDLCSGLRSSRALTTEEWRGREHDVLTMSREMRATVAQAWESTRANWRATRHSSAARELYELARALEQLSFVIEDITDLLVKGETSDRDRMVLGPGLRPAAADALEQLARALRRPRAERDADLLRDVDESLQRFVKRIREEHAETGDDLFAAGTLVMGLRRALAALAPSGVSDELPSRH